MSVTVIGDSINEVRRKTQGYKPLGAISIFWRSEDFGRLHKPGCIIDGREGAAEEVPMLFENSSAALEYIAMLLKRHDDAVETQGKLKEVV